MMELIGMNWYNTHYLCKHCIGCEAVAEGEGNCLCEEEEGYYDE